MKVSNTLLKWIGAFDGEENMNVMVTIYLPIYQRTQIVKSLDKGLTVSHNSAGCCDICIIYPIRGGYPRRFVR